LCPCGTKWIRRKLARQKRSNHEVLKIHLIIKNPKQTSPKHIAVAALLIFLAAFGVRLLSWQDTRLEVGKVQSVVASDYQRTGRLIREGGLSGFFRATGPLADPNLLGHPPGYAVVLAFLSAILGDSNNVIQLFQMTCDALAAVVIFLIAIELFPLGVGVIAGLLAAFSPQFAWNSVLLLPDSLAVLPLLLAIYCLTRALKKPRLITVILAGVFVGLSCWLRANGLLMAPFIALVGLILFPRDRRFCYAGALLLGAVFVVAPLTIRNWLVFDHFIPVSLGAGQTMLEGISDYDPARRFGIPNTDMAIMKMEAEQHNRPDYYSTLFAPDGIKRERMRLARGLGVIRNNPIWFASVMARRAGSMLRLERARLISTGPPVTHDLNVDETKRVWVGRPAELLAQAVDKSPDARFLISTYPPADTGGTDKSEPPAKAGGADKSEPRADTGGTDKSETLQIISDTSKYGVQLKTAPLTIKSHHDYLFKVPVIVEEGRMTVDAAGTQTGRAYASAVIENAEVKEGDTQPRKIVALPFVGTTEESVSLLFRNAAPASGRSRVDVGQVELFDLGAASFLWTRYPRFMVSSIQRLFITAVMLPLALFGAAILVRRRAWKSLVLLLSVPAYYFCFQSMLHTEYRYVLAIHYFLFVLVALAIYEIGCVAWGYLPKGFHRIRLARK
jgi:dolichyl-phosphate-mannose-protein mannosyltransferase